MNSLTQKIFQYFKFRTADFTSERERGAERFKRIFATGISSVFSKSVSLGITLITIPLTLKYLGAELYGLWMTLTSIMLMMNFVDLGIGNGLLNVISEFNGRDDREGVKTYISSAFFELCIIALIILIIFFISYRFLPFDSIFNIHTPQARLEAGPACAIFITCFALNIPLSICDKIRLGYQEGHITNLWQSLGSVLGLVLILLCVYSKVGLPWLILAFSGAPLTAYAVHNFYLFFREKPWLRPSLKYFHFAISKRLLKIGLLFFILQAANAFAFTSDNIILAQTLGAQAVSYYSIPTRLFSIGPLFLTMFLTPLWPAYGEAISRGDMLWAKQTLIKSLVVTLLFIGFFSLFLLLSYERIINLWIGPNFEINHFLIFGLALWCLFSSIGNSLSMFLNAANIIKFQVVSAILMSSSAIALKIFLTQKIGLPGVIWATIAAYSIFTLIPCAIYVPKLLAHVGTFRK